ncbi:MAG: methionine--tRNA ligase, partial [Isosphaeraceae bacterium]
GNFSYDALVQRYNSDLANGLGNLATRTLAMIHQNYSGTIPSGPGDPAIAQAAKIAVDSALDS